MSLAAGSPAAALQSECAPLARELVSRAAAAGLTVATAESLTAGLVAATIADVPGASAVLRGGVVSYAVEVKASVLGVDAAWLAEHGPVDPRVAEEMAIGAARVCDADLGVSTTGVAGPEPHGGREVGTVYLGVAVQGSVARSASPDAGPVAGPVAGGHTATSAAAVGHSKIAAAVTAAEVTAADTASAAETSAAETSAAETNAAETNAAETRADETRADARWRPSAVGHVLEVFPGDRDAVRWAAVKAALELLLSKIPA